MKNESALMNSALAAIVALGGFGLADDTIAVRPKGEKGCAIAKASQYDHQTAASGCAGISGAWRADHIMESRHAIPA